MSTDALTGAQRATEDAPTTELLTGVVGDRCPNCQAPMAADQRYCLTCGARRGRARFSPETLAVSTVSTAASAPPIAPQRSRFSAGTTIVAGVATLLIAMGVGVLIGAVGNNAPARTPPAQIVTVGGGGAAAANTTAAKPATPAQKAASAKAARKAKRTVVHVTAKTAKAATAAASKVLGSSKNLSNNVQQSVGGSCSGGAGCQNGKFTGNFFPSG